MGLSINKKRLVVIRKSAALLGVLLLAAGCGRTLPTIDEQVKEQKRSVLLVTSAGLSDETAGAVAASAASAARKEQIALETLAKRAAFDESVTTRLTNKPYDSVIVVGNELIEATVAAAREHPSKRFVLLQTGERPAPFAGDFPTNLVMKAVEEGKAREKWDEWVKLQRVSGLNLLWVSRSTSPVSASWAPSEEADAVLNLDFFAGEDWFPQLTYQARSIQANWIVLHDRVDEKVLTKIKTLRIPVIDMTAGITVNYHWGVILPSAVLSAKEQNGKQGNYSYSAEEVTIERK